MIAIEHVTIAAQREVIKDQAAEIARLQGLVDSSGAQIAAERRMRQAAERLAEEARRPMRWDPVGVNMRPDAIPEAIRTGILQPAIWTAYIPNELAAVMPHPAVDEAKRMLAQKIGLFFVDEIGITTEQSQRERLTRYTITAIIGRRRP